VPGDPIVPLVFVGTCGFLLYRSLLFTFQNQAVQAALYVMAAGVVAWIIARMKKAA
jgi:hypothetical protein